ncbi:MAG: ATP-binding cassette domain-containing protein [Lewinellaceae bacterium]|nr:ATP-binding cassette domain-containing protein [Lewinellaceae bacterium]
MIRTQNLEFRYQGSDSIHFPDLQCVENDKLLVLGHSGVGKSTLLHLLGGLIKPIRGKIEIGNTDISTLGTSRLDAFRGKNIGIIFQQNHFIQSLNVLENVLIAQSMIGTTPDVQRAKSLLDSLNLSGKYKSKMHELSQGERQRVAIARAAINSPKVILADEPTSALDDEHCNKVFDLMDALTASLKCAFVIVTHDNRLKDKIDNQVVIK